jgi:hypothetical protein
MLAGYEGNRHSGLGGLRHRCQLLLQRISTPALHSREHFNSINSIRHRRITRLTPSPSLCSYGPVEMGAAPSTFNIADVTASINATAFTNVAYQVICRTGATPYFYVHKLVRNGGQPQLRRYARTLASFFKS